MSIEQPGYITKDGSFIREIIRPERQGSRNMSLAEAVIPPGEATFRHYHLQSEEIYYILTGEGMIELEGQQQHVRPGDAVFIPPRTEHGAKCLGDTPLRLLCVCSPPYQHEDTILTNEQEA